MFVALFSGRFRQLMILIMNNVDFVFLVILNRFPKSGKSWKQARSLIQKARKLPRKRYRNTEKDKGPITLPGHRHATARKTPFCVPAEKISAIELALTKYRWQRCIPC
jgi:hypothetical protein